MVDVPSTISAEEKKKLLLVAAKVHVGYKRKAGAGRGVDRRILDLKLQVQLG
ncbi:hypothetical protein BBI17_009808, partial [Phytophthora kernoviae]